MIINNFSIAFFLCKYSKNQNKLKDFKNFLREKNLFLFILKI